MLSSILTPPTACLATPALKFKDKRKGALWHCPHAHQNIGKGRKAPDCLCKRVLGSATLSPTQEATP